MLKKIDVEKSVVYNNITNKLDGLYLGQIGYFSDSLSFGIYETNQLYDIVTSSSFRYRTPTGEKFTYFIPADKVVFIEPKKLRPFKNIEEFFKKTENELGKVIRYREKKNAQQVVIMINGYTNDELVIFGGTFHSLTNLFERYEYYDNDNTQWKPFGVEE